MRMRVCVLFLYILQKKYKSFLLIITSNMKTFLGRLGLAN